MSVHEVVMHVPSARQYEQLVEDCEVLRSAGADSNTQAILEAVRAAADRVRATPQLRKVA